jgi:L-ascorbate metabolism protein UlaG (beta-lactamase superfamily)
MKSQVFGIKPIKIQFFFFKAKPFSFSFSHMRNMLRITWIAHACFLIEHEGKNIYFDPYEIPTSYKTKAADAIFASHDHYDHFDEEAVKHVIKESTEIVCPTSCAGKLTKYKVKSVKPGESGVAAGCPYKVIPAYNPNKKFHPKSNNWAGYIVDIGGTTIFHAGDTDDIPEFSDLKGKVDVAILPVGGTYTMDFNEAVSAVSKIQPKYVIPMHHWDKDLHAFQKMCEKTNPSVKVAILTDKTLEI